MVPAGARLHGGKVWAWMQSSEPIVSGMDDKLVAWLDKPGPEAAKVAEIRALTADTEKPPKRKPRSKTKRTGKASSKEPKAGMAGAEASRGG